MIDILDKVFYGLGALTSIFILWLIVVVNLFLIWVIITGIANSFKKDKQQNKTFGGKND